MLNLDKFWEGPWSWKKEQDRFRLYLLPFSSECCMYSSIKLKLFLWYCVGWNLVSYVKRRTQIEGFWVKSGEENVWCECGVGIEGCGIFCSELHVCYSPPDIINIIIARKVIHLISSFIIFHCILQTWNKAVI